MSASSWSWLAHLYQRVALGRLRNQTLATIPDVNRTEILTFVGLGVLVVWVGIFPDTFVRLLGATTAALAG